MDAPGQPECSLIGANASATALGGAAVALAFAYIGHLGAGAEWRDRMVCKAALRIPGDIVGPLASGVETPRRFSRVAYGDGVAPFDLGILTAKIEDE